MPRRADLDQFKERAGAMPAGVRRAVLGVAAVLLASALYLVAARGQALLLDLSVISQRILCF